MELVNLFSSLPSYSTSLCPAGVLPRQGVPEPGRPPVPRGARPLLLHARPGHGARPQRHHQAPPPRRSLPQAADLLRRHLDPPQ
jgi:hypothetical protein